MSEGTYKIQNVIFGQLIGNQRLAHSDRFEIFRLISQKTYVCNLDYYFQVGLPHKNLFGRLSFLYRFHCF